MNCPLCDERNITVVESKTMKDITCEAIASHDINSLVFQLDPDEILDISIETLEDNGCNVNKEYHIYVCEDCGYIHDGISGIKMLCIKLSNKE